MIPHALNQVNQESHSITDKLVLSDLLYGSGFYYAQVLTLQILSERPLEIQKYVPPFFFS